MSFKSIIQDMRGELGSISRKGFDVKFGYGLRSRSHRVVQDCSVVVDAFKQSCWANMPPELLRDVLMRIEASELTWPPRKNVVACAGVCRSWRENMKEIVKTLEVSAKLTFPISLKQVSLRLQKKPFSFLFQVSNCCCIVLVYLLVSHGVLCIFFYIPRVRVWIFSKEDDG